MTDTEKDFYKELFKEINSHIRATDRKSLIVTGAYIGLFSIFLSSFAKTGDMGNTNIPWLQVAVQGFFLCVGSCIYLMQQWYRAWKEHYIDVCVEIRKQFIPEPESPFLLPYWLRTNTITTKVSIDNMLKYLTATINFLIVFIICYQLLELMPNRNLAIIFVAFIILLYIGLLYFADRVISKQKALCA